MVCITNTLRMILSEVSWWNMHGHIGPVFRLYFSIYTWVMSCRSICCMCCQIDTDLCSSNKSQPISCVIVVLLLTVKYRLDYYHWANSVSLYLHLENLSSTACSSQCAAQHIWVDFLCTSLSLLLPVPFNTYEVTILVVCICCFCYQTSPEKSFY